MVLEALATSFSGLYVPGGLCKDAALCCQREALTQRTPAAGPKGNGRGPVGGKDGSGLAHQDRGALARPAVA
jgi:hypothetical protein